MDNFLKKSVRCNISRIFACYTCLLYTSWENISVLYKAGVLQNNKAVKRFCDKLRIRTGYDRDQCLQGLSEMVFWLYAIKNSYTYEMDKKLKNQENTDVDIQLLKYGYKFNIEIKTPKQVKEDDDKVLGVNIPFRSFKNKDTQKTYIDKLEKEVFPQIINKPDGMYTGCLLYTSRCV